MYFFFNVQDFRQAVSEAEDEDGQPVLQLQRLEEILGELPQVYSLHSAILAELEERISHWYEKPSAFDWAVELGNIEQGDN